MSSGEEEDRSTRRETELEDGEEKPVSRVSEQTIDESKVQGVFVGNLSVEVKKREIEDLFIKFGNIARIDLKIGYAFVFLEGGAEEAVRELDRSIFQGHKIRVETAKGDGRVKQRENERKISEAVPVRTLFIANVAPRVGERHLRDLFEPYGVIVRIELRKNFAFVEFEKVEDATAALRGVDGKELEDRVLSVEYVKGTSHSSKERRRRSRSRSRSYERYRRSRDRRYSRSRSRSPYRGRRDEYDRRDRRRDYFPRSRSRSRSRSFERRGSRR